MPLIPAQRIPDLLAQHRAMDGADIETGTGLSKQEIKAAAIELRTAGLIRTSGAPDMNEDDGMAIDRLEITTLGLGKPGVSRSSRC